MAERRMLSHMVMEEDALLALPPRVVIVYILANLHADDDGMVDRIRSICKMMGGAG